MGQSKRRRNLLGGDYGKPPEVAWHYTIGRKIPLILESEALRDDWTERKRDQFPHAVYSVWFTRSQNVDPTSTASLTYSRSYPGQPELFKEKTGGHWRVGLPLSDDRLLTYAEALEEYPPSSSFGKFFRGLPSHGENRKEWLLALVPIECESLIFQELRDGEWITHSLNDLPRQSDAPGYGVTLDSLLESEADAFFSAGSMFAG